jgi:uncharacterized protein (DUF433 family)
LVHEQNFCKSSNTFWETLYSRAGTRITVQSILELINEELSFEAIVQDYYPDLEIDDIKACVQYAIAHFLQIGITKS